VNTTTITRADRAALENLWADAGAWAADSWSKLNEQCFDGKLRYRGVVFGLTKHGGALGHTSPSGRITLHPALLDPQDWDDDGRVWKAISLDQLGDRYAADVLVHEMIHVWIRQQYPALDRPDDRGESSHNYVWWCREITRISPVIGLGDILAEPVLPRRIPNPERGRNPKADKTIVVRKVRDGYLTQSEIGQWPHSLRPASYYAGSNGKLSVPI
jgi:hypothetical protein